MDGDGHDLGTFGGFQVVAVERVAALLGPVRGFMVLHDHHRDVVVLHRVGQRHQRTVRGLDFSRFIVVGEVADVLDARGGQQIRRFVRLGEPGAKPPHGPLAGEALERVHRSLDHGFLVFDFVDGHLLIGMAHEFPVRLQAGLRHAGVVHGDTGVDRKRRTDPERVVELLETPEAHAHAVLVPGPVRDVGLQRDARGRGQHLARHRAADVPHLQVDDGPDDHFRVARQLQHGTVDDGGVGGALARGHGHVEFLLPVYLNRQ